MIKKLEKDAKEKEKLLKGMVKSYKVREPTVMLIMKLEIGGEV